MSLMIMRYIVNNLTLDEKKFLATYCGINFENFRMDIENLYNIEAEDLLNKLKKEDLKFYSNEGKDFINRLIKQLSEQIESQKLFLCFNGNNNGIKKSELPLIFPTNSKELKSINDKEISKHLKII